MLLIYMLHIIDLFNILLINHLPTILINIFDNSIVLSDMMFILMIYVVHCWVIIFRHINLYYVIRSFQHNVCAIDIYVVHYWPSVYIVEQLSFNNIISISDNNIVSLIQNYISIDLYILFDITDSHILSIFILFWNWLPRYFLQANYYIVIIRF